MKIYGVCVDTAFLLKIKITYLPLFHDVASLQCQMPFVDS